MWSTGSSYILNAVHTKCKWYVLTPAVQNGMIQM